MSGLIGRHTRVQCRLLCLLPPDCFVLRCCLGRITLRSLICGYVQSSITLYGFVCRNIERDIPLKFRAFSA